MGAPRFSRQNCIIMISNISQHDPPVSPIGTFIGLFMPNYWLDGESASSVLYVDGCACIADAPLYTMTCVAVTSDLLQ